MIMKVMTELKNYFSFLPSMFLFLFIYLNEHLEMRINTKVISFHISFQMNLLKDKKMLISKIKAETERTCTIECTN